MACSLFHIQCQWRPSSLTHISFTGFQRVSPPGPCLNIKTIFPRYGDSHVKDKIVAIPSYLWHGDPYTGKMTSLYWDSPLVLKPQYSRKTRSMPLLLMPWFLTSPGLCDTWVTVIHEERFQLPALSQCWQRTESVNIFFYSFLHKQMLSYQQRVLWHSSVASLTSTQDKQSFKVTLEITATSPRANELTVDV